MDKEFRYDFEAEVYSDEARQELDFKCGLYSKSAKNASELIVETTQVLLEMLAESYSLEDEVEVKRELAKGMLDEIAKFLLNAEENEYPATADQRKSLLIGLINSL